VIRKQLGALGEVLRLQMENTLAREGIRRGEVDRPAESIVRAKSGRVSVAERELGDIWLCLFLELPVARLRVTAYRQPTEPIRPYDDGETANA
jgi:hypothetical protein